MITIYLVAVMKRTKNNDKKKRYETRAEESDSVRDLFSIMYELPPCAASTNAALPRLPSTHISHSTR